LDLPDPENFNRNIVPSENYRKRIFNELANLSTLQECEFSERASVAHIPKFPQQIRILKLRFGSSSTIKFKFRALKKKNLLPLRLYENTRDQRSVATPSFETLEASISKSSSL
jgi:hypothetical protein